MMTPTWWSNCTLFPPTRDAVYFFKVMKEEEEVVMFSWCRTEEGGSTGRKAVADAELDVCLQDLHLSPSCAPLFAPGPGFHS